MQHHHARAARGQVRTDIRLNELSDPKSGQTVEPVEQARPLQPLQGRLLHAGIFDGPTIDVARQLIGAVLYRRIPLGEPDAGELLAGRIVETEAYLPLVDPSCHGYRGPTKRNASLFGRPGFAYVYLIYGMYYCLNVTTEPPGIGAAVLIRALEPVAGVEAMRRRRHQSIAVEALASGPGNLCRAMSIDLHCDGADLRHGDLRIESEDTRRQSIAVSGRIGVNSAQKWPLRFYDVKSPSVSPFRKGRQMRSSNGAKRR